MNKELLKMAKTLSFTQDGEVIYGEIKGYVTTISEQANNSNELFISLLITNSEICDVIKNALNNNENKSKYSIFDADVSENYIRVLITENPDKIKNINEFCSWFCPYIKSLGVFGSDYCSKCKKQISNSEKVYNVIRGRAYAFHNSCAQRTTLRPTEDYTEELYEKPKKESSKLGRGIIGALLGGLLGSMIWALIYSLGFIIGYVGVFIGFAAIFGYLKFGGPNEPVIILVVVPTILFSIIFGEYLGICLKFWYEVVKEGSNHLSLFEIVRLQNNLLLTDIAYRTEFIREYFRCLGYSALGASVFTVILWKRSKR